MLSTIPIVLVAGIYGAVTANRKILYVQALPALLAFIALIAQSFLLKS